MLVRAVLHLTAATKKTDTVYVSYSGHGSRIRDKSKDEVDQYTIKAVHMTELRSALDAARAAIGLPALVYTDPTITPGSTVIKAAHVTEVRAGTQ